MSEHHDCTDCKRIFEKLSEYIDQELDQEECLVFEEHIRNCRPCLEFLETLHSTIKLSKQLDTQETYRIPRDVSLKLHEFLKKECKLL
ncbi:MAG: zf-HC2 domain-containing protein [Deltaproteobacteria bacterium]|nr:zf-HC2 domain-containing protein [Candidatus Zymogenaceae bacterium]